MTVAHTIDRRSRPSPSSGSAERSSNAARAVLLAVITALVLALIGAAYLGAGTGESFADPTLWTD